MYYERTQRITQLPNEQNNTERDICIADKFISDSPVLMRAEDWDVSVNLDLLMIVEKTDL